MCLSLIDSGGVCHQLAEIFSFHLGRFRHQCKDRRCRRCLVAEAPNTVELPRSRGIFEDVVIDFPRPRQMSVDLPVRKVFRLLDLVQCSGACRHLQSVRVADHQGVQIDFTLRLHDVPQGRSRLLRRTVLVERNGYPNLDSEMSGAKVVQGILDLLLIRPRTKRSDTDADASVEERHSIKVAVLNVNEIIRSARNTIGAGIEPKPKIIGRCERGHLIDDTVVTPGLTALTPDLRLESDFHVRRNERFVVFVNIDPDTVVDSIAPLIWTVVTGHGLPGLKARGGRDHSGVIVEISLALSDFLARANGITDGPTVLDEVHPIAGGRIPGAAFVGGIAGIFTRKRADAHVFNDDVGRNRLTVHEEPDCCKRKKRDLVQFHILVGWDCERTFFSVRRDFNRFFVFCKEWIFIYCRLAT